MSAARSYAAIASSAGRVYVVGGSTASGTTTSLVRYDPATNLWANLAPAPSSRAIANLVEISGSLYYLGGCTNNSDCRIGTTGLLEAYSVATNTWSTRAPMPTPRNTFAAAAVNGILYAVGGRGACPPCDPVLALEAYDPATNLWTTRTPLPTVRYAEAAVGFAGKLYVIGGAGPFPDLATVDIYDPVNNTWSTGMAMPTARQGLGVAAVGTGFFAIGGYQAGTTAYRTENEFWNSSSNTWATRAALPVVRYQVGAAEAGGLIYVIGAQPANALNNQLHIYVP